MSRIIVQVIVCCYGRKYTTINCLSKFYEIVKDSNIEYKVTLVDDKCPEYTGKAVELNFPQAKVVYSSGNLYWAKSMSLGIQESDSTYDYLLWLNDDVDLYDNFSDEIEKCIQNGETKNTIWVGATNDSNGKISYSGVKRGNWPYLTNFKRVYDRSESVKCDAFNGNFVLIPKSIDDLLGGICDKYTHGFSDFDYGLRCSKHNLDINVIPKFIGHCERNSVENTYKDNSLSREKRLKLLFGPKGLPFKDWLLFNWRHAKSTLIVGVFLPYLSVFLNVLFRK